MNQTFAPHVALDDGTRSLTLAETGDRRTLDDLAVSPIEVWGDVIILKLDVEDGLAVHDLFLSYLH